MLTQRKKLKPLEKLKSIKTGKGLQKLIVNLKMNRRKNKITGQKRHVLSKAKRKLVLDKTEKRCHICGIEVTIDNFQADHVKSHAMGGAHSENNYLPSCPTCNNYRWHYSPEEIQIILKMGVWVKTKVVNDPMFGLEIANAFVKHEMGVRKRRKIKVITRKSK